MEAAKEELEVFEALADLADNAFDPVTEKDKREIMKDKLNRYNNIMTKKGQDPESYDGRSENPETLN